MARRTTAAKTGTTKKSTANKATPAKAPGKPASRKTAAKKPAAKTAAKKPVAKPSPKPTTRKTSARKAPARKAPARKAPARKSTATKTAAKTTAPKATAPKTAAAKAPAPAGARARPAANVRPSAKARTATDAVLGQILRLMMASPKHRHMFLADMEVQVIPPLRLGQCRVLRNSDGAAFAYASWAKVSDAVHARLEAGERRLRPQDWNSGPNWWLIDIAAPARAIPMVMAELQKHVFKDETVRTLVGGVQQ